MIDKLISIKLLADVSQLKAGMNEAVGEMDKVKKEGGKISGAFKAVGGGIAKGMAVGVGAIAAVGAVATKTVMDTVAKLDDIDKSSQKALMSAEGWQEWNYVLGQNGIEVGVLQTAQKKLVKTMEQAEQGGERQTGALKDLGLTYADLENMSPEEKFNTIVASLQGVEDESERAKLAQIMFGGAAQELSPLLNQTAEDTDALKGNFHALGGVISDDAVAAGAQLNDTLDNVKQAMGGVVAKIGIELMPIFQTFLDWVLSHMPTIQEVVGGIFKAIGAAVNVVIDIFNTYFLPAIQKVVAWIQENFPAIQSTTGGVFNSIKQVWNDTLKPVFSAIMGVLETVWGVFKAVWPAIQTIVKVAFDIIKTVYNSILKPVFGFIVELVNKLKAKFDEHMPAIKRIFEAFGTTIKNVWKAIKPIIEAIGKVIKWLFDKFMEYIWPLVSLVIDWFFKIASYMAEKMEWASSKVGPIIEGIMGFFGGIADTVKSVLGFFDNIKDGIVEKIDWAKDKVGGIIQKIKDFFDFDFTWPKLKMPKFSITGSMNPVKWIKEGVPKLSVSWNARGAIFKKPTILANGQGVGDASNGHGSSPEVVAPLSDLKQMLGLDDNRNKGTTINLNGDYSFRDKEDMDYLMNQMALAMRRT